MLARLRKKNLHTGCPTTHATSCAVRARHSRREPRHLLFALCDHYEPLWGRAPDDVGRARVDAWAERYPALAEFRDSDGRPPRHGWFFPGEEYRPHFLDRLAELARGGFGEVEFHLHHDGDTARDARAAHRASTCARSPSTATSRATPSGGYRWAFIHGNWCLANGRPDGRWCGVDDELVMLHELGCYVDLTFPSAPDPCQPDKVNQIYWPTGDLDEAPQLRARRARARRRAPRRSPADDHRPARARAQGRSASGSRTARSPATIRRPPRASRRWIEQGIHVEGRPEWMFVKVHTHGAIEKTAASLLGDGGRALHARAAASTCGAAGKLHYVTAREMFNVARAAMDGKTRRSERLLRLHRRTAADRYVILAPAW